MRPGDKLILTKGLGTGTLFAADMRLKAKGRWITGALESMLLSNYEGARILHSHGATACTDVTGFGLLGHLVEMTKPSEVDVELRLADVPILDGALQTVEAGIFSSLQPENVRLRRAIGDLENVSRHPIYPLIFDPQTAGGLLASVPADKADACRDALLSAGYPRTTIIGEILPQGEALEPVRLIA
jgi:selenide,water dikinase